MRLLLDAGGVYAVHGVVIVVARATRKPNRSLVTTSIVKRSRGKQQEACPVAAVDWQ